MCLSDTLKVTPPPRLQRRIATATARERKTQIASKVLVHARELSSGPRGAFSPASHRAAKWTFGDEPIDTIRTESCVLTAEAPAARSYYEPLTFLIRSSRGGFSPVEVLGTTETDGS